MSHFVNNSAMVFLTKWLFLFMKRKGFLVFLYHQYSLEHSGSVVKKVKLNKVKLIK